MFDLSNIDFIKTDQQRGYSTYAFVGLQKNKETDRLEFWLPLGFDDFDDTNFNLVKGFFFKMYRTFKTYLQRKQNDIESKNRTINRDGIIENENGFSFINENNEQIIFYGKLNSLDKILEGYDELIISSLEKKHMKSPEIDYSKIHQYMHQAIYLDNDVIYIDEMNIAKNILIKESPPILQLFCFIYTEIKKELLEQVADKAVELAEQFKDNYLQLDSSLFSKDTFAETVDILKETLEDIDIKTTYKDEDYWHFFDAIEAFLYGDRQEDNKGIYWGFSSFYDIWEDMCQTYVLNTPEYKERVIFADVKGEFKNFLNITPNPFELKLNNFLEARYLRPDLVLKEKEKRIEDFYTTKSIGFKQNKPAYGVWFDNYEDLKKNYPEILDEFDKVCKKEPNPKTGGTFQYIFPEDLKYFEQFVLDKIGDISFSYITIVDYKYMRILDYENYLPNKNNENKVKDDIKKQLIYEWSVQQNWNVKTESEFWIPYFFNDPLEFEKIHPVNNTDFNKSQIKLVKINFKTLQDFYIKQGFV